MNKIPLKIIICIILSVPVYLWGRDYDGSSFIEKQKLFIRQLYNEKMYFDTISETAQVTAEWIHYVSQREGGSAYTLGDFDYSPTGMIRKFPLAVWVTLYRPHLWEVNNIVMLLSALESFLLLSFTIYVLYKVGILKSLRVISTESILIFCFLFAIIFAFAVGVSTYNFGSLVRYKIPMFPYFVSGLVILLSYAKRERKREVFD